MRTMSMRCALCMKKPRRGRSEREGEMFIRSARSAGLGTGLMRPADFHMSSRAEVREATYRPRLLRGTGSGIDGSC